MKSKQHMLSGLPSIEKLVRHPQLKKWGESVERDILVRLAQEVVDEARAEILKGNSMRGEDCVARLENRLSRLANTAMQKVINGTGVVLHTNLGRAPIGRTKLLKMADELSGYCSLEFDLASGERGSRTKVIERLVNLVVGSKSCLVVNNNAAATFLILNYMAKGKEVIISRSELVQIGGGYRVPDILAASGAILKEVGTTNITSVRDFEKAISEDTGAIMKVHQSNFFISGHTEAPKESELAKLSKKNNIPFIIDLGSGLLNSQKLDPLEPRVQDLIRLGADLVCFSGDKLLGGPQAGIIVGEKEHVSALKKSPLYRALRLGKTELFLLEQTLRDYIKGDKPLTWQLLEQDPKSLKARNEKMVADLKKVGVNASVIEGTSSVGGGTMPACQMDGYLLEINTEDTELVAKNLRKGTPSVVPRLEKKRLYLDLRTVLEDETPLLVECIKKAVA